jgi:hypothetical protein
MFKSWLAIIVLLCVPLSFALTLPGLSVVSSRVDIFLNQSIVLNVTFAEDNVSEISHFLIENNGTQVEMDSNQIVLNRSIGQYEFYVCAETLDNRSCSEIVRVNVTYSRKPIVGPVAKIGLTPVYGDRKEVKETVRMTIDDPNSISIIIQISQEEDDIYGDDMDSPINLTCLEVSFNQGIHDIDCVVFANYSIPPGSYKYRVRVNNSYGNVEDKYISDKLYFNVVLSAEVSKPSIDFGGAYSGWISADPPINIRNIGNTKFENIGIRTDMIECRDWDIDIDSILINYRFNRASAIIADPMVWFERDIGRAESQDLYVFVEEQNESLRNCIFEWDLDLTW